MQAPDRLDAENPWPGLHEFGESDKDFFNGRDREKENLLRLVNDAPLTVLFGASGLGKTSLLLAGLLPRLRAQNKLPIYVRLDPRIRDEPIIEQAFTEFRKELGGQGIDHPKFEPGESLWEYLHRSGLELWSKINQLLTPVFIFDQFEEMFTIGDENAEAVNRLREDLADLVENLVPATVAERYEKSATDEPLLDLRARRCKALLSFREDFLPDAETWRGAIPSLMRSRMRLMPMDGDQAYDAVTKTGGKLIDSSTGREIVKFVAAARERRGKDRVGRAASSGETSDLAQLKIEPALLSLVCTRLNERRKAARKIAIDQGLLDETASDIVKEFYEDCVRDLPDSARRFIENELITEAGFRDHYSREDAITHNYLSVEQLDALVNGRLIRVEEHLGAARIELVHDLLTEVVRDSRDARRRREEETRQREEKRREHRKRWRAAILGALGISVVIFGISVGIYVIRDNNLRDAEAKHKEALQLAHKGHYDEALTKLSDSLSNFETWWGERSAIVRARVDRGKIFALSNNNDKAIQDLIRALEEARVVPASPAEEALALESLASFHDGLEQGEKAIDEYDSAMGKYETIGDLSSIARILEWKANRNEAEQKFELANYQYGQALKNYQISGDMIGVTRTSEAIKRTVIWGYLVDLKRGEVFTTHGSRFTIGRDVPEEDLKNDLSFSDRAVSRRHLEIAQKLERGRRTFQIEDFRSLNGSTLNAVMLRYADRKELRDGDIITLANNTHVLQFTTAKPETTSLPTHAWAIFIDGSSRKYSYLTDSTYSIVMTSSGFVVEKENSPTALLKVRRADNKFPEISVDGRWSVCVKGKITDYAIGQKYLTTNNFRHVFNFPAHLVLKTSDQKQPCDGPPFQIVPLLPKGDFR